MKNDKEKNIQSAKRDMEKFMKKISAQNFDSEEEMQSFMNNLMGKKYEETFSEEAKDWDDMTPQEQAENLIDQAHAASSQADIVRLAEKAIEIDPDCAEAYQMIADHTAKDAESAKPWFKKAMEAARRTIGKEAFEEYRGHFWGFHETRPYMRAKESYASMLIYTKKIAEGVAEYKEMLELNPNDNQGVRYVYGAHLVALKRYEEFEELLEMFPDEGGASWLFNKALYVFATKGVGQSAVTALLKAHEANVHVLPILAGKVDMSSAPPYYSPGDENEAQYYAREHATAWMEVPDALNFAFTVFGSGLKKSRIRSRNRKVKTMKRRKK